VTAPPWRSGPVASAPDLTNGPSLSDSIRLSSVTVNCSDAAEPAAGATRYQLQPNADHCLVFADPAGHPFRLTTVEELG
jgi:hypothetical protein